MSLERKERVFFAVYAVAVVVALALAFFLPAFARTGGAFPVPLDDVYIHFGFARSAALLRPFEGSIGNGYSSGGTSFTYPFVLAPAWLLGFRGARLAWFAAGLGLVCVWDLCWSLRELLGPRSRLVSLLAPFAVLSIPLVDWSLFSGMETALFAALLGRSLLAARRAIGVEASERARAQLSLGMLAALVVATRPESLAYVGPLAIAAVFYGARSLGTTASLARTLGPTALFLVAQAAANRALTGELGQAGAVRKLVGTNPYVAPTEAVLEVVKNLAVLRAQAFDAALGGAPYSKALFLLALVAVLARQTRRYAVPLCLGALGMLLLVSLNTTARYQNFRYAVPSLLMLLLAAALGACVLSDAKRPLAVRVLGVALWLVSMIAPSKQLKKQIEHFARASANIEGQQALVARKLAALTPKPRRVFVNDAGAIPYLSELPSLDGLGLGGYHDLPFARASVHGVPAVIELIERMPEAERPDVLAMYPSWWPELAASFGHERFTVRIDDNVICGAPEKVVYDADWSLLASSDETRASAVDVLDVADLVDERAHRYMFPRPRGGWVIGAALRDANGKMRYDAGRIIPQGQSEQFVFQERVPRGPGTLVLRTDGGGPIAITVSLFHGDQAAQEAHTVEIPARAEDAWYEAPVELASVGGGDRVEIAATRSAWRSFHVWLQRP